MSDLISRQAAIDLWEQYHPYIATKACEYDTMLRKLPSAQPEPSQVVRDIATIIENEQDMRVILDAQSEQRWIPCSERLPEDGTEVFVYLFDIPSPYIAWIEDTHWYTEDFEVDREDEPIAWMPLPEPYKGEQE